MSPRSVAPALLMAAGALVAGCSSSGSDDDAAPSPSASRPSGSGSASGSASGTPSESGSASATAVALPQGCTTLLPFADIDKALGKPVFGQTRFIEGAAQPSINRTARITCRYGVQPGADGKDGPTTIEVGISAYTDEASAQSRVKDTITTSRSNGDSQKDVTVAGVPATVLSSTKNSTLVLAQGVRTVAVTVAGATLPPAAAPTTLPKLAEIVVANLD